MEVGGCVEATRVVSEAVGPRGGSILPLPLPLSSTDAIKVDGGCHPPRRLGLREVTFGARRRGPPLCNVGVETCMCRPRGGTVKPGTGRRTDAGLMGLASASRRAARWREPHGRAPRGTWLCWKVPSSPTRAHGQRIPRYVLFCLVRG